MEKRSLFKNFIIDDFIGGKKGRKLISELRGIGQINLPDIQMDLSFIQKRVVKKLAKKHYDLMIFIETGGPYFLGIPGVTAHAKKIMTLPVSAHSKVSLDDVSSVVSNYKSQIESSRSIAVVEGDVGACGHSLQRIKIVKACISEINEKADTDFIVGITTLNCANAGIFNIIGVVAGGFTKLSDIALDFEMLAKVHKVLKEEKLPQPIHTLLDCWHRRKTLPVVAKK